jgi:hypothetical protein
MEARTSDPRSFEAWLDHVALRVRTSDALDMSQPGPADDTVAYYVQQPYYTRQFAQMRPEDVRDELAEYGAWDAEDLADDEENLHRLLWCAAGTVREQLIEHRREVEKDRKSRPYPVNPGLKSRTFALGQA